jgi:hypothetical protein
MKHLSFKLLRLTRYLTKTGAETRSGGQFNWGGFLQKRNGGVQRSAYLIKKLRLQAQKYIAGLTVRQTGRTGAKAGFSDPYLNRGIG